MSGNLYQFLQLPTVTYPKGRIEVQKINCLDSNRFCFVRFFMKLYPKFSNKFSFLLLTAVFSISLSALSQAPILSGKCKVSIITCGPGEELYEAFGHSAIRVLDEKQNLDLIFNYGVFNFNQPNFYGNFAKGSMRYMLGVSTGPDFINQYQAYNRSVREQVLNLDSMEKQQILNYLDWNLRPENKEYFYDYFDNNCSTKIIELLDSALQHKVVWNNAQVAGKASFRSLIYDYTTYQNWGRLGIDLGLGAVIDKPIEGKDLNFLPDELEKSISRAVIQRGMIGFPLVSESKILFEAPLYNAGIPMYARPEFIFTLILIFCFAARFFSLSKATRVLRATLFSLVGLLGWFELIISLFTNHKSAAWNLNLFWANPLFLFLGILCIFNESRLKNIFNGGRYYLGAVLMLWFFIPQTLNVSLLPLVGALFILTFPSRKNQENLSASLG